MRPGVEQLVDGDAHGGGVGHLAVPVGERQPDRLGHGVQVVGRVVAEGREVGVDLLQQRQFLEQRHPLGVRGERLHFEVVVAGADGLGPFRQIVGEVVGHEQPAAFAQEARDASAEGAGVELFPAFLLQRPEGRREVGARQDVARPRGGAAGQEDARRLRLPPQFAGGAGDVLGEPLGDGQPRRGEVDGRLQGLREGYRPEAAQAFRPGPDGAGDRDAEGAVGRHPLEAVRLQFFQGPGAARAARAVQGVGQPGGRVPVQEERVAAHPVHVGRATASTAAAVTAASMASPPARSTRRPASAARGWPAVTAPVVPRASRPARRPRERGEEAGRRGHGDAGGDSGQDRRGVRPRGALAGAVCGHGLLPKASGRLRF